MKQLDPIQRIENLNDVFAIDEPGPGGAYHVYAICKRGTAHISDGDDTFRVSPENLLCTIQMQQGARKDSGSTPGALDCDLLEIVRDRLTDFQAGPYACRENRQALAHVHDALKWLNARVWDRATRGVLGTERP